MERDDFTDESGSSREYDREGEEANVQAFFRAAKQRSKSSAILNFNGPSNFYVKVSKPKKRTKKAAPVIENKKSLEVINEGSSPTKKHRIRDKDGKHKNTLHIPMNLEMKVIQEENRSKEYDDEESSQEKKMIPNSSDSESDSSSSMIESEETGTPYELGLKDRLDNMDNYLSRMYNFDIDIITHINPEKCFYRELFLHIVKKKEEDDSNKMDDVFNEDAILGKALIKDDEKEVFF